jgi:hypothetical protein
VGLKDFLNTGRRENLETALDEYNVPVLGLLDPRRSPAYRSSDIHLRPLDLGDRGAVRNMHAAFSGEAIRASVHSLDALRPHFRDLSNYLPIATMLCHKSRPVEGTHPETGEPSFFVLSERSQSTVSFLGAQSAFVCDWLRGARRAGALVVIGDHWLISVTHGFSLKSKQGRGNAEGFEGAAIQRVMYELNRGAVR